MGRTSGTRGRDRQDGAGARTRPVCAHSQLLIFVGAVSTPSWPTTVCARLHVSVPALPWGARFAGRHSQPLPTRQFISFLNLRIATARRHDACADDPNEEHSQDRVPYAPERRQHFEPRHQPAAAAQHPSIIHVAAEHRCRGRHAQPARRTRRARAAPGSAGVATTATAAAAPMTHGTPTTLNSSRNERRGAN
jgi:hypothetical protein